MERPKPPLDRIKGSNETTPSTTFIGVAWSKNEDATGICRTYRVKDEATSSLRVHVFPLAMTTRWTLPQQCGKPPTTRRRKNTAKLGKCFECGKQGHLARVCP